MPELNKVQTGLLPKIKMSWEVFDALPHEAKEFLWYAPSKLSVRRVPTKAELSSMRERITRLMGVSTYNTYGPDHPQAIVPGAQAPADIDF